MTLLIDGQQQYQLIVETAPIDIMPHSVRTFMDMVENKAWEGTTFMNIRGHNGIVISSDVDDPTTRRPKNDHLVKQLLFPEYSPSYPHVAKTFGFGGRPGGPNFYINLKDNIEIHGPGGQRHDVLKEADSCFARITRGEEAFRAITGRVQLGYLDCKISRLEILKDKEGEN